MRRLAICCLLLVAALPVAAQNFVSVTAANIQDPTTGGNVKLVAGKLCFLATNGSDIAIPYKAGGGGQVVNLQGCTPIANGAITGFSIANPANTNPAHILYRITVYKGSSLVASYPKVDVESQIAASAFNFDTCNCTTSTITPTTPVYATVLEEGSALQQRTKINFIGASVTAVDDPTNGRTNVTVSAGGSPGGSGTQLQFNDGGAFAGDSALLWDKTNHRMAVGPQATLSTTKGGAQADNDGESVAAVSELATTISDTTAALYTVGTLENIKFTPSVDSWTSNSYLVGHYGEFELAGTHSDAGGETRAYYLNMTNNSSGNAGTLYLLDLDVHSFSGTQEDQRGISLASGTGGTAHATSNEVVAIFGGATTGSTIDTNKMLSIAAPNRTGTISTEIAIDIGNQGTGANDYAMKTGTGKVDIGGTLRVAPVAFASLAACAAGNEGQMAPVNNSTTAVWGATITGGGANHVLAYCDGTNWTVAGK